MNLIKALMVAASGMKAQGSRMKVIAENLANSDSLSKTAGGDPYKRKVISFRNELDRASGASEVKIHTVGTDKAPFPKRFDPGHPAADGEGYVKLPNVNTLVEMSDMREAQRSYEANLNLVDAAKSMLARTIELLR
jgi:flagellar basal-body rod protein FlgC